jgi:HSP20 family protein
MSGALAKTTYGGLRNWVGFEPFASMRREFDELLSRFGFDSNEAWAKEVAIRAIDLSETESTVELRMDVPGVSPENIDIQIRGNLLTISGESKEEKEEKDRSYHRVERRQGAFSRTVTLPCQVVESKAKAEIRAGVLTLSIPKTELVKAHKVTVRAI